MQRLHVQSAIRTAELSAVPTRTLIDQNGRTLQSTNILVSSALDPCKTHNKIYCHAQSTKKTKKYEINISDTDFVLPKYTPSFLACTTKSA